MEDIVKILMIDKKNLDEKDFVLDTVKKEIELWKKKHPGILRRLI
jgi:molybdopterin synthase catalytic subunit